MGKATKLSTRGLKQLFCCLSSYKYKKGVKGMYRSIYLVHKEVNFSKVDFFMLKPFYRKSTDIDRSGFTVE